MTPTTGEVAALLAGMVLGVVLHYAAIFILLGFWEWRSAIREGTPLSGEGLERLKKRGEL